MGFAARLPEFCARCPHERRRAWFGLGCPESLLLLSGSASARRRSVHMGERASGVSSSAGLGKCPRRIVPKALLCPCWPTRGGTLPRGPCVELLPPLAAARGCGPSASHGELCRGRLGSHLAPSQEDTSQQRPAAPLCVQEESAWRVCAAALPGFLLLTKYTPVVLSVKSDAYELPQRHQNSFSSLGLAPSPRSSPTLCRLC